MNYDGVNNIFEKVSKSADNIKKDFKKGYEESKYYDKKALNIIQGLFIL